jgi:uncharacterized protein YndB with AHSA1/START domain
MDAKNASISADQDFVITRIINAPRALVFKAWTDPKQMAQWWGPKGFTNPVCEMDVRPGGAHRIVMRGPDGTDYPVKGVYREIVEPERLVMTLDCSEHPEAWHDMVKPNRKKGERNPVGEMLQTVTFEDQGGKTKLTVRTRFNSTAIRDAMVKMGMSEGWAQSLDRLQTHVANTADREIIITRVLNAPRELVFKAWTESEHLMRWWAPKGCTTPFCKIDLRPGGKFHYCMRMPEGRDIWGIGVYREIVAPSLLVYTDSFADAQGNPVPPAHYGMSASHPAETFVTVTFEEHEGKTKLTLRHAIPVSVEEREGTEHGWIEMLDRLAEDLANT